MAVPPSSPNPTLPSGQDHRASEKSEGALASGIQLCQGLKFPGPDESLQTHAGSNFRTAKILGPDFWTLAPLHPPSLGY